MLENRVIFVARSCTSAPLFLVDCTEAYRTVHSHMALPFTQFTSVRGRRRRTHIVDGMARHSATHSYTCAHKLTDTYTMHKGHRTQQSMKVQTKIIDPYFPRPIPTVFCMFVVLFSFLFSFWVRCTLYVHSYITLWDMDGCADVDMLFNRL